MKKSDGEGMVFASEPQETNGSGAEFALGGVSAGLKKGRRGQKEARPKR